MIVSDTQSNICLFRLDRFRLNVNQFLHPMNRVHINLTQRTVRNVVPLSVPQKRLLQNCPHNIYISAQSLSKNDYFGYRKFCSLYMFLTFRRCGRTARNDQGRGGWHSKMSQQQTKIRDWQAQPEARSGVMPSLCFSITTAHFPFGFCFRLFRTYALSFSLFHKHTHT